jgi:hypothetical protein
MVEEITMSYFDQWGNMRMHKDKPVENGILFRWYYEMYYAYYTKGTSPYKPTTSPHMAISAATNSMNALIDGRYRANPPEDTQHFSRDNMYGLYGLCYVYRPEILKDLPVFRWNNRKGTDKLTTWWHPNGWMVFLALNSKFWAAFFLLPIALMIAWSHIDYENNPKDTSGLCLWVSILPLLAQQNKLYQSILDEIAEADTIPKLFDYYCSAGYTYDNKDNPIRELISG